MGKRLFQRLLASVLVIIMLISSIGVCFAASAEAYTKQEVVYVNLSSDGSVKDIYVVNIFDLNEDGEVVDYGDYEELRNMSSDDEIVFADETVQISTDEKSLYYEAKLKGNLTPWNFDIRYFLDGIEYPAEELAGRTGSLSIKLNITANDEKYLSFFENYVLKLDILLDTKLAENITAEGATITNKGRNKNISYIAIPGFEHSYEINADVNNFEMEPFEINGYKLNLDMDDNAFVGTSVLTSSLKELENSARRLDQYSANILDLTSSLSQASKDLLAGVDSAKSLAGVILQSVEKLEGDLQELTTDSDELNKKASCLYSNNPIFNTLSDLLFESAYSSNAKYLRQEGYAVKEDITYKEMRDFLQKREDELNKAYVESLEDADEEEKKELSLEELCEDKLYMTLAILTYFKGVKGYSNRVACAYNEVSEINELGLSASEEVKGLSSNTKALTDKLSAIGGSASQVYEKAVSLRSNCIELKAGADQLLVNVESSCKLIVAKIIDEISSIFGKDFDTHSYVDRRNDEIVDMVQFVFNFDGIKLPEVVVEDVNEPRLTFWQKLLKVFAVGE